MNPKITRPLHSGARAGTSWLALVATALLGVAAPLSAASAQSPGLEAIEAYRAGPASRAAVENRFFKKENRLEIAPLFVYSPNNSFVQRLGGGGILGFHFSENWSAQFQLGIMPDNGEGDLKDLTSVLLQRAQDNCTTDNQGQQVCEDFVQPLDKITLAANVGVAWAPVYGKINLVGETVLNFDFYVYGGVGFVTRRAYQARYEVDENNANDIINLGNPTNGNGTTHVGPVLGVGQNYFLNQTVSIKLDLRNTFFVSPQPSYVPDEPATGSRLSNNLTALVGFGLYFPGMKPRLYDF